MQPDSRPLFDDHRQPTFPSHCSPDRRSVRGTSGFHYIEGWTWFDGFLYDADDDGQQSDMAKRIRCHTGGESLTRF